MPSHHRRLVHRHAQRILANEPRDLGPGEARLFSYYAPSLDGGLHKLTVKQKIDAPPKPGSGDDKRRITKIDAKSQSFIVVAPRFSLPAGIVDSVYPTSGSSVEHTILPHITFKDPHLPWARAPSHIPKDYDKDPKDEEKKRADPRSRTPWLALVVFSMDELRLSKEEMALVSQNLPEDPERTQTETCSLQMQAKDTPLLSKIEGLINTTGFDDTLDARDATEGTAVIFPTGKLFTDLFAEAGVLHVGGYRQLAHVRQTATDGMANAGSEADEAYFSIVVSRRCGPIDAPEPSMMVVHLLSLCWDSTMPLPKDTDRVAVTTLHSWTYTCLASLNVASTGDMLINLGEHLSVLRTEQPEARIPGMTSADDGDEARLHELIARRQQDGYVLARHRTVTGEVTASMLRGPLVPTQVAHPLNSNMCMQSNFGSDLAIFDPNLGMLDNTYANAWQLGRTLAMADDAFCAALARLRNAVQGEGHEGAKKEVHAELGDDGYGTRRRAADRMVELVRGLNALNGSLHAHGAEATAFDANRWSCEGREKEEVGIMSSNLLSQNSSQIGPRISAHADAAAHRFAMATDSRLASNGVPAANDKKRVLFNEYNDPSNPDFAQVYSWVLDKIHLGNVPAHYLIPDPAFLPQETLRFFHLDLNWTDALIDGALSLANHRAAKPHEDTSRTAIKKAVNECLRQPDAALGGWHVPLSRYGFILRSQLLVQFPDLAVDVKFANSRSRPVDRGHHCDPTTAVFDPPTNVPARQPILVQKRIAPDTMYLLFDAAPPDLQCITFTMPCHQQCFRIGKTLTSEVLTVLFKRIHTTTIPASKAKPGDSLSSVDFLPDGKTRDGRAAPVFNWQTRLVNPLDFGTFLIKELKKGMGSDFDDDEPTSAVTALQLNDPILQLDIGHGSAQNATTPVSDSPFQLSVPSNISEPPPSVIGPKQLRVTRGGAATALRHRASRSESPTRDAQLLAHHQMAAHPFSTNTNTPPLTTTTTITTDINAITTVAPPSYLLKVYHIRSPTRDFVPSDSPLPIDLVFSLTQRHQNQWTPLLRRIYVAVPYGRVPEDVFTNPDAFKPLLAPKTADPAPSHPAMLGNLRLNVLKRWGADDDEDFARHIVFELVPRQTPGILVKYLADASFRLPRARIADYKGTEPLKPVVKVRYEFLNADGKPERAGFKSDAEVPIYAASAAAVKEGG